MNTIIRIKTKTIINFALKGYWITNFHYVTKVFIMQQVFSAVIIDVSVLLCLSWIGGHSFKIISAHFWIPFKTNQAALKLSLIFINTYHLLKVEKKLLFFLLN